MAEFVMTDALILTLKGAPISIICLMITHPEPLGAQFIERHTGYNDKYTASALLLLEELGLVTRNGRYNWQLAAAAQQLPLVKMLGGEEELEPDPTIHVSDTDIVEGELVDAGVGKSESENPTPSSSSSSNNLVNQELDKPLPTRADSENPTLDANLAECDRWGILEPKRSSISILPHVVPRLIRYHVQTSQNIGQAIWRTEHKWPIKAGWVDAAETPPTTIDETPNEPGEAELAGEDATRWAGVLIILKNKLRRADYETWIRPLRVVACGPDGWMLRIGNGVGGEWIRQHALEIIEAELGVPVRVVW